MSKPVITGITVSLDIANKEFGNGSASFMNVQGKYPDPATLDDVLIDGLDMYFAAFRSLLASRYATGLLSGPDFKDVGAKAEAKYAKIRAFLVKEQAQEQSASV